MVSYKVKVKWGRENYAVEVNAEEMPMLFKAQLYALTGVLPERQKVMCKGITLKDDEWNVPVKEGAVFLLLGTKEEVPTEPQEKTKFIEDMSENELATALELPAGLKNLGNTCYMNATIQCLRSCPELRDALKNYPEDVSISSLAPAQSITAALRVVFDNMDNSNTVTPVLLLQTLHIAFPQFAQTGENGVYRQQDANECWSELLKMLQQKLTPLKHENTVIPLRSNSSFIDQYFGGKFEVEMKCAEAPDEKPTLSTENFLQLSCFISQEVKYMQSGLKSKMKEQITKMSSSLGRDAVYTRNYLINRLPAYLTINFVRFQYKGKEGINAKVLKDIKFPIDFDAFDLCSKELQQKLTPMRSKFKIEDDALLERIAKLKDKPTAGSASTISSSSVSELADKKPKTTALPYSFENDVGSNNSGYYTLQAVLTHKGRSSSSGHYVGWVRQTGDKWMKFDDDDVSPVLSEDILRLSGGGDWHCAYVLLYGPKILEIAVDESDSATTSMEE